MNIKNIEKVGQMIPEIKAIQNAKTIVSQKKAIPMYSSEYGFVEITDPELVDNFLKSVENKIKSVEEQLKPL